MTSSFTFAFDGVLEDVEEVVRALRESRIDCGTSSAKLRIKLKLRGSVVDEVRRLLDHWRGIGANEAALIDFLEAVCIDRRKKSADQSRAQVVWSGSYGANTFRQTQPTVNALIASAKKELVIATYWIRINSLAARHTFKLIEDASKRGVKVHFFLHENSDDDESHLNAKVIFKNWNQVGPQPNVWEAVGMKGIMKMHAKVLIADQQDALIGSANFTQHGLDQNIEIGVRVVGRIGEELAKQFHSMAQKGEFARCERNSLG